jgi:hypothetical protein
MPEQPRTTERAAIPRYEDPIRIVPLHVPRDLVADLPHAGPTPAPKLTYRGGPLIANVKVFIVFWGSAWQNAQSALATQIENFFQAILSSSLIDQLAEYSTPQVKIGHGQVIGKAVVTSPTPRKSISDTAIRTMLQHHVATDSNFPQPDANTLYFVYAPPGSVIVQGGSRSCQAFCGYHENIGGQLFYAAMPYPNCNGCLGGLTVENALTSTSSHEMCEAITDPIPGQGWYDDVHGEIGDICAWQTKTIGQWTVQLEWSNKAGACV